MYFLEEILVVLLAASLSLKFLLAVLEDEVRWAV